MQVKGARVLITGASGGIGQALAEEFAASGAELVLSGRRGAELETLAARTGGQVVVADLALREDVDRLLVEAGEIDVLVANAALPASGDLRSFTAEQLDRALEVNLRAPLYLAHALAPVLVGRGKGALVFISSLSGVSASPGTSLYSATKFGMRGFAHGLRQDLHGTGVGVSVVLPGFISDAGMFADSGATPPPGFGTKTPKQVATATVRAVEHDIGEVVVAPRTVTVAARLGGLAPALSARLQRSGPAARTAGQLASAQRDKR